MVCVLCICDAQHRRAKPGDATDQPKRGQVKTPRQQRSAAECQIRSSNYTISDSAPARRSTTASGDWGRVSSLRTGAGTTMLFVQGGEVSGVLVSSSTAGDAHPPALERNDGRDEAGERSLEQTCGFVAEAP